MGPAVSFAWGEVLSSGMVSLVNASYLQNKAWLSQLSLVYPGQRLSEGQGSSDAF